MVSRKIHERQTSSAEPEPSRMLSRLANVGLYAVILSISYDQLHLSALDVLGSELRHTRARASAVHHTSSEQVRGGGPPTTHPSSFTQEGASRRGMPSSSLISAQYNSSTCVVIRFIEYGRTGNFAMQYQHVKGLLRSRSGLALSTKSVNSDSSFAFPPVLLATRDVLTKTSAIEVAAKMAAECRQVEYKWMFEAIRADGFNVYSLEAPWFRRYHSVKCMSMDVSNTIALHFRSGDTFSSHTHHAYTQPLCSHFTASIALLGKRFSCVALLTAPGEPSPCVSAIKKYVTEQSMCITHLPENTATCALDVLARAPAVVESISTFYAANSVPFPGILVEPYCALPPRYCPFSKRVVLCTDGSTHGLIPWIWNQRARKIVESRPSDIYMTNKSMVHLLLERTAQEHRTGLIYAATGAGKEDSSLLRDWIVREIRRGPGLLATSKGWIRDAPNGCFEVG